MSTELKTQTGIPVALCDTCGYSHPVTRTHCHICGSASPFGHEVHASFTLLDGIMGIDSGLAGALAGVILGGRRTRITPDQRALIEADAAVAARVRFFRDGDEQWVERND